MTPTQSLDLNLTIIWDEMPVWYGLDLLYGKSALR